jgi:hypothetical protein
MTDLMNHSENSTRATVELEHSNSHDPFMESHSFTPGSRKADDLFFSADNDPITYEQATQYLKTAGALSGVMRLVVRQHLLAKELRTRPGLDLTNDEIEDGIVEFRSAQQIVDRSGFNRWLEREELDRGRFRQQICDQLKLEKLKIQIAETDLQEYFITQKGSLDQVVLSRIVVRSQSLADELRYQIQEKSASFEQLAQEYSITEERVMNGMIGRVSRGELPDELRSHIDTAQPGDVVGPINNNGLWYLIRIEQFLPASLTDELKQQLREQLFDKWLSEKVQQVDIKTI